MRALPALRLLLIPLLFALLAIQTARSAPTTSLIVINEIDYDQPNTDNAEFIEIYNGSGTSIDLDPYSLRLEQRDFSYIDDIADGTLQCLQPYGYEIFNLGNDNPVELKYVISMIEDALGKKASMKFLPRQPADVFATWADIEKSREKLKWYPNTTIEEGIKKTVQWYIENGEFVNSLKG